MRGRARQRAAAQARGEGRRDQRRGDGDRGRAERDCHGHERHPEEHTPREGCHLSAARRSVVRRGCPRLCLLRPQRRPLRHRRRSARRPARRARRLAARRRCRARPARALPARARAGGGRPRRAARSIRAAAARARSPSRRRRSQTHVADIRDGLHELARRFPEAHQRADRGALRRGAGARRRAAAGRRRAAAGRPLPRRARRAAPGSARRDRQAHAPRRDAAGDGDDRDALVAQLDAGQPIVLDGERFPPALWRGLNGSQPAALLADLGRPRDRAAQRPRDVRPVPPPAAAGARDRRGARLRGRGAGLGALVSRRAFVVRAGRRRRDRVHGARARRPCALDDRDRPERAAAARGPVPLDDAPGRPASAPPGIASCAPICAASARPRPTSPEATIHEHYRSIERGLHVDDLLAVVAALDDDGTPLVLFGSCGGAVTAVRAAEREPRVQAVIGYALPGRADGRARRRARGPPRAARVLDDGAPRARRGARCAARADGCCLAPRRPG